MIRFKSIISVCFLFFCWTGSAQIHPHILIHDSQKQNVLELIERQMWAKSVYEELLQEVDPYVLRHQTDPAWILDRYLMNRVPDKRYTRFISDKEGTKLVGYQGDAPVPTVRVSPHKRIPLTSQGHAYLLPKIEDLVPNDTSLMMNLYNPDTKQIDRVDPQSYVGKINQKFNELAYKSAVLYWLTSDEKYAKFSADLLNQWGKGAYYQELIDGPGRTGFLDIQTLGDEASKSLIIAYDFVYPYMEKSGYDLSFYEVVFEKIASTLAFRGYTGNNWYAAESSTMVAAALSLRDKQKQSYYLDFYLNRDTVSDGCGQLGLPSTAEKWFTPDGHWKEPGGYHNYPVSKLIESAFMLENNGYQVFLQYPVLLQAAYVMLKYSFPNLTASAFGDTGRPRQDFYCLEIGIRMAEQYQLPVLKDLVQAMDMFRSRNLYDRESGGVTGLLCYAPELPSSIPALQQDHLWPRTGKLDFASFCLQRNGMDAEEGLMCTLQGATYNHNHSNGMAIELYGKGTVMGIDPGNGPTYEHPLHVGYYTQWAAHNTVVAAGASTSTRPFTGGGGTKEIGAVKLVEMEPVAGSDAVSDYYSFVLADYPDASTKTNQQRLLSLIRTDDRHGYYLDIYYSDNPVSNDYLYHNIGDTVFLLASDGKSVQMTAIDSYPQKKEDLPGLRYFNSVSSTGVYNQPVTALFSMKRLNKQMKMWMPASKAKSYYTAWAPSAKTAVVPYDKEQTPVVAIRMEQEAESNPFVVVYEPSSFGQDEGCIQSVKQFVQGQKELVVRLELKGKQQQTIFKGIEESTIRWKNYTFSGIYGLVTEKADKEIVYMGKGKYLENATMHISMPLVGAASIVNEPDCIKIKVSDTCNLYIKDKKRRLAVATSASSHANVRIQPDGSILVEKGEYVITL